jgi:hypothetical protein
LIFLLFQKSQKLYEKGNKGFVVVSYFLMYHMITGMSETYFGKYSKFMYIMFIYISIVVILSYNYEKYKKRKSLQIVDENNSKMIREKVPQ